MVAFRIAPILFGIADYSTGCHNYPPKRGGARAIYLRVPEAETIVLVTLYTTGDKADLTPGERLALRALAAEIKSDLL